MDIRTMVIRAMDKRTMDIRAREKRVKDVNEVNVKKNEVSFDFVCEKKRRARLTTCPRLGFREFFLQQRETLPPHEEGVKKLERH